MELRDDWHIAAAAEIDADGARVSSTGLDTAKWIATSVPSTPMAALVASGEVERPYFNRNLERVPGDQLRGFRCLRLCRRIGSRYRRGRCLVRQRESIDRGLVDRLVDAGLDVPR